MDVGERVRETRKRLGVTQVVLGDRMGLKSYRVISMLENGHFRATLDMLHRVAVALGVPPSELDPRLTDRVEEVRGDASPPELVMGEDPS